MNYKEYMKVVEEKLSIMAEEEKIKWIYNKARIAKKAEDLLLQGEYKESWMINNSG